MVRILVLRHRWADRQRDGRTDVCSLHKRCSFFLPRESLELTAAPKKPLTHVFSKYPLLTRHLPPTLFCISCRLSKRFIHLTLPFSYRLSTWHSHPWPVLNGTYNWRRTPCFRLYTAQKAMLSCVSFTISIWHKKLMLPCICYRLSTRHIHCRSSTSFTWNLQLPLYCASFWRSTQYVSYHRLNTFQGVYTYTDHSIVQICL